MNMENDPFLAPQEPRLPISSPGLDFIGPASDVLQAREARYRGAIQRLQGYIHHAHQDPERRVLYESQVPIMEDIHRFLVEHHDDPRGYISLPTGVGKTVLFTEFVKATGLRTLVLTPTQLLLRQTEDAFGKFAGDEDVSVGTVYAHAKDDSQPITITTYASFVRHAQNEGSPYLDPSNYDVVILDEAHRAMGEETTRALKKFPNIVQVGLTATENYSDKRKLSSLLPHEIHKMSIVEAVDLNLISPFSVFVVETETDMSQVRVSTTNEYDQTDLQKTLNTEARNMVAVEMYIKYFMGRKAMFFCSGVDHAKALAALFEAEGVPIEAIHGGLTIKQQELLKVKLADPNPANNLFGLTNDKILAEGFDVPSVSLSFNLAPTLSTVRSQQRSGRTLRLDPDNPDKHAIIIEFIDKNYPKPPVLFADPKVAGTAHLGSPLQFDDLNQTFNFNLASAHVITNPELVEQMAVNFEQTRRDNRPPAPEGWLTMTGICNSFEAPASTINHAMRRLKEEQPDFIEGNSGRFLARGVEGGLTTYYAAEVLAMLEPYMKQPDVAPRGWLTAGQVASRYNLDLNTVYRQLKEIAENLEDPLLKKPDEPFQQFELRPVSTEELRAIVAGNLQEDDIDDSDAINHMGEFVEHSRTAKKKYFFSPQTVEQLALRHGKDYLGDTLPPPHWLADEQLAELYGPNASKAALERLAESSQAMFFNHSVEINGKTYYGADITLFVRQTVVAPTDWKTFEKLIAGLEVDEELALHALGRIKERYAKNFYRSAQLAWVDGQEVMYYRPSLINTLRRMLDEMAWEGSTVKPQELTMGVPVLIPKFERTAAPIIDRDPFSSLDFKDVIRIPSRSQIKQRRAGASIMQPRHTTKVSQSGVSEAKPQQLPQAPVSPDKPQGYLSALKRFKRR